MIDEAAPVASTPSRFDIIANRINHEQFQDFLAQLFSRSDPCAVVEHRRWIGKEHITDEVRKGIDLDCFDDKAKYSLHPGFGEGQVTIVSHVQRKTDTLQMRTNAYEPRSDILHTYITITPIGKRTKM